MDRYSAHDWNQGMPEGTSMEFDGERRSEGEIYSDGDSYDDFNRIDRKHRADRSRSDAFENRTKDESRKDLDEQDRNHSRSSRKDRSRDRRDNDSSRYKGRGRDRSDERKRSRSPGSSRGHDRKSRKHKHKSRHRRYSSSDSRSSSRSGGKSRRRRSRSYDSYSSTDSREYYSDYYNDRGGYEKTNDSYKFQEPNSTVMVRGMASHLTEQDIRADLLKCGILVKDIRLIRHRETGASRGFAFVEFHTVQEATRWMEMKMGSLILQDEYHASLIYSVPKVPVHDKSKSVLSDWYCSKCQAHNFKRRENCYKCHQVRPEDQDPELTEEFSPHPTSTIILYNLDALTTEESVLQAFKSNQILACIPVRSVRIAREAVTNLSRGLCYVDTNNVADAVRLHNYLIKEYLTVDSRQASVAYAKSATHGVSSSSVAATALAAAQWTNSSKQTRDEDAIERMAQYSASLYAKTPEERVKYVAYYRDYFRKNPAEIDVSSIPYTKGAESIAATSTATVVMASSGSNAVETRANDKILPDHSIKPPDTSRYQYDDASGYYYDPATGFYYDASTQYFYDSVKQHYLFWNPDTNQYLPVNDTSSSVNITDSKKSTEKKKEKKVEKVEKVEKQDKVKVAKKIAKDMEKWAKTLNQKKEGFKPMSNIVDPSTIAVSTSVLSTESALLTEEKPQYTFKLDVTSNARSVQASTSKSQLVATYGEESDSEDDNLRPLMPAAASFNPDALVDFNKLACLLCKRQFPNKDVLMKHTKLSDLHKKNLEEMKKQTAKTNSSSTQNYRDRAKERRMKFGSDPVEGKNSLKDLYMQARKETQVYVEEPTRAGIKDDNIGNRMLQKMGWQEGQGLGRGNQGRTDIITAERRAPQAGLGHRTFAVVDDEDDRQYRARKLTLARYQELE